MTTTLTTPLELFVWLGAGMCAGVVRHFVARISHTQEK